MVRRNTEPTDRFSDLVNIFAPPTTDSADDLVYSFNDIPVLKKMNVQLTLAFVNIKWSFTIMQSGKKDNVIFLKYNIRKTK